MPLSVGEKLGPYEILALIGAGGMGEVYRARDTRLGRDVALKVSHEKFTECFEQEARSIAALNHPNICHVYDVGPNYLVMELIDGIELKGPLPTEKAVEYAGQILDALDAAHRKGITHRDLKPANILVTKQGIKLLDFGLAKKSVILGEDDATRALTIYGQIVGTLQYMSPEQLQGKEADPRSDLFSFGCVLYELLSGARAFDGPATASVIAAILEREPASVDIDRPLDRVIRRSLTKDPDQRFQTARDLKAALNWAMEGSPTATTSQVSQRSSKLPWAVAGMLALGSGALAFLYFREKLPASAAPVRFQIAAPENTTLGPTFDVSPDGRKLVFVTAGRLWVHSMESGESRELTAGASPFWSPDSRFIAYPSENKIKRIEATGGLPQTVADYSGGWRSGAWNQDDLIVFGVGAGLFRVSSSGGVPVQITALDPARQETGHWKPSFLPDGRHFVYLRSSSDEAKSAIYVGSVDAKPEQQSSNPLVSSRLGPVYAPSADPGSGYLLFTREGTLLAQPLDNRRLEVKGEAKPVADRVGWRAGGALTGAFSASANDVLVYQRGPSADRQLTWYDREGNVLGTPGEQGEYQDLELSPDGTRVALIKRSGQASNVWLLDLSRDTSTRFTLSSAIDASPVWSPDGSRVVFSSNRDGAFNLYQKPVSGVKDVEILLKSSESKYATSWSRDGRYLLYDVSDPKTKGDIWLLPLEGDRKQVPFLISEFNESQAQFSPDGHWAAYVSDESGHAEVYVRSFGMSSAGKVLEASGRWQISNGLATEPTWRRDGRELYYRSRGTVMAVEITTNPAFRAGKPRPLGRVIPDGAEWSSNADGKSFLVAAPIAAKPEPYTLNWQAVLKN